MFMFLPFLVALIMVFFIFLQKKTLSYSLWGILVVVVLLSFKYHATSALGLSF